MARSVLTIGLAVILSFALSSPRASAQTGCTSALISLAPCLGFLQTTNPLITPSPACCTQLSNVVQTNPRCLCIAATGGPLPFGVRVNQTKAIALPAACNVTAPPVSQCYAPVGAPAPGPAGPPKLPPAPPPPALPATPTPTPPVVPSIPTPPSPSGGLRSGGRSANSLPLLYFILCVTTYASSVLPPLI